MLTIETEVPESTSSNATSISIEHLYKQHVKLQDRNSYMRQDTEDSNRSMGHFFLQGGRGIGSGEL